MKRILNLIKKLIPSVLQLIVVIALILTGFIAYNLGAGTKGEMRSADSQPASKPTSRPASSHPVDGNGDGVIYVGSMHPQIQQDEPGDCPICGMELVATDVSDNASETDHDHAQTDEPKIIGYACAMNCVPPLEELGDCPICGMEMQPVIDESTSTSQMEGDPMRRLTMSHEAKTLASIQTSEVVLAIPEKRIRLVGELAVGESTLEQISVDVGGRIDRFFAEYEGDIVEKGEELVLLYSPELLAVQQEYLQAKASLEKLSEAALETIHKASKSAVEASRERLRLAGFSAEQIDEISLSGEAKEQFTITAPITGTVITRHVQEGEYVTKGERILTIANLETLWAEMAAYESDMPWLRIGQPVTFTSESFPGEKFSGEVAWIDPITSVRTRTTSVRLNVENTSGKLRPGMYITAHVESSLGDEPQLTIPTSAPLITGDRAIVYIEVPDAERPTFQGTEVVLGPRTEDGYVVIEGLVAGQRVVTNGAFQIDSALQIIAKPSMMNPAGGQAMTGHAGHGDSSMGTESESQPTSQPTTKLTAQNHGDHAP